MRDGEAFPTRADLDELANTLEEVARTLAGRVHHMSDRPTRRTARRGLTDAYGVVEALRSDEPGSRAAALSTREGLDLVRQLVEVQGLDPLRDVDLGGFEPPSLASALRYPRDPMRLRWPITYDLHRHERLGEAGWQAYLRATKLDEIAARLEARSREAAGLGPPPSTRKLEPELDVKAMDLAHSKRRRRR